jgi:hypothetical protein
VNQPNEKAAPANKEDGSECYIYDSTNKGHDVRGNEACLNNLLHRAGNTIAVSINDDDNSKNDDAWPESKGVCQQSQTLHLGRAIVRP